MTDRTNWHSTIPLMSATSFQCRTKVCRDSKETKIFIFLFRFINSTNTLNFLSWPSSHVGLVGRMIIITDNDNVDASPYTKHKRFIILIRRSSRPILFSSYTSLWTCSPFFIARGIIIIIIIIVINYVVSSHKETSDIFSVFLAMFPYAWHICHNHTFHRAPKRETRTE